MDSLTAATLKKFFGVSIRDWVKNRDRYKRKREKERKLHRASGAGYSKVVFV